MDELSRQIIEHFTDFQFFFDLDLQETEKNYHGCCPIHQGDNPTAFVMYKNSGYWMCHTHGCHNHFQKTALGFIHALMSVNKKGWAKPGDPKFDFQATVKFVEQFLKEKPKKKLKDPFRHALRQQPQQKQYTRYKIPIEKFKERIKCPSQYYLDRGFDEATLEKFLVGDTIKPYGYYANRAMVPFFDEDEQCIVGFSARSHYDKCIVCNGFHHHNDLCVTDTSHKEKMIKWMHSTGFNRGEYLYNYWNLKKQSNLNSVILVEGPSEVWKLDEAGFKNSMAILGANVQKSQLRQIDALDLQEKNIITIMDNDEAGEKAGESCKRILYDYKFWHLTPPKKDLGEMTKEEIQTWIKNLKK